MQVMLDCKDALQRRLLAFIVRGSRTCWVELKTSIVQQAINLCVHRFLPQMVVILLVNLECPLCIMGNLKTTFELPFRVVNSLLLLASLDSAPDCINPVAFIQLEVLELNDSPKCPSCVTDSLLSPVHNGLTILLLAHVVGDDVICGCSQMILSHVVECFPSEFIHVSVDL